MYHTMRVFLILLVFLSTSGAVYAHSAADTIKVADSWVREVPPVSETSAVFMTLINNSEFPLSLVSAESDAARIVELHTHETDDKGVHRMFKVKLIDIAPKSKTFLKPMSYHVMLIGLNAPLKEGDTVSVKLNFHDGSSKVIKAPVRKMMMSKQH